MRISASGGFCRRAREGSRGGYAVERNRSPGATWGHSASGADARPGFAGVNDALSEKVGRDALDRLRETAAHADPAKVGRMLAHIDTQVAALSKR